MGSKEQKPESLLGTELLSDSSFYRDVIAEFVATFLFLYVTILTVIGYKAHSSVTCGGVGILGIAWSFGGMIFILVYCTGGHINPAVTFGMWLARKVSLIKGVVYIVAQCLGAICGCGLVKVFHKAYYNKYGGGANQVAHGYSKGAALGAEIVGTFILLYTIFSTTYPIKTKDTTTRKEATDLTKIKDIYVPALKPLAIGFAVFMVHLATIPITGTSINPARSLGPAVMYNKAKTWDDHWIFWVGPFIGASIAAIYHLYVLGVQEAK